MKSTLVDVPPVGNGQIEVGKAYRLKPSNYTKNVRIVLVTGAVSRSVGNGNVFCGIVLYDQLRPDQMGKSGTNFDPTAWELYTGKVLLDFSE
jgi:hypothetical protein